MSLSGSHSEHSKSPKDKNQDVHQQASCFPLESMTSRRPAGVATSLSRTSSASSKSKSHAQQSVLQPQPQGTLQDAQMQGQTQGQTQQEPQLLSSGIAREDTPIMISRGSTPRSYLSTTTSEDVVHANGNGNGNRNGNGNSSSSDASSREAEQRRRCGIAPAEAHPGPQLPASQGDEYRNGYVSDRPWYKKVKEKYGSLELENKGSVARDHLALERTFLSWLRTSLAFASIGIAITQLFRLNTSLQSETASLSTSSSNSSDSSKAPANAFSSSSSPVGAILPPKDHTSFLAAMVPVAQDGNFERLRNLGKPLGATFIGIAIVVLLVGFHRYFESQYWVVRGKFPASRGSIALVAFFTCALMIASLVVILTIAPGAWEA